MSEFTWGILYGLLFGLSVGFIAGIITITIHRKANLEGKIKDIVVPQFEDAMQDLENYKTDKLK